MIDGRKWLMNTVSCMQFAGITTKGNVNSIAVGLTACPANAVRKSFLSLCRFSGRQNDVIRRSYSSSSCFLRLKCKIAWMLWGR